MSDILNKDLGSFVELEKIIKNFDLVSKMDETEISEQVHKCVKRINTFNMGGRSTCLIRLSLILWGTDKSYICTSEIEELLSMSFRIATDPSFIFPEWGIILAGVLIARYIDSFEEDKLKGIENQCKRLLNHITDRLDLCDSIRVTADALLNSWKNNFNEGLEPLVKMALASWPNTSTCQEVNTEELENILNNLAKQKLAADFNINERKVYRLLLEKQEKWDSMERINIIMSKKI